MAKRISLACRIPMWRRRIKYPLYQDGDPQLQIVLPQFWMKVIKPRAEIPPTHVHFKVHPQMSKYDIKQYLQKIYNVTVSTVRTEVREGETVPNGIARPKIRRPQIRKDDEKIAYVTLANGEQFVYPGTYEEQGKLTELDKLREQAQAQNTIKVKDMKISKWDRRLLPPWFR